MGDYHDVPSIVEMNYLLSYPKLCALLRVVAIDSGLCAQQFRGIVSSELNRHPELKLEVVRSFEDADFSWMDALNHEEIGEVCECETEEEARQFATEMFLKPATG